MTELLLVTAALLAGWAMGRRERTRPDHEPRLPRLLSARSGTHRCSYERVTEYYGKDGAIVSTRVMCVVCKKPPPTGMPGGGVPMSC